VSLIPQEEINIGGSSQPIKENDFWGKEKKAREKATQTFTPKKENLKTLTNTHMRRFKLKSTAWHT